MARFRDLRVTAVEKTIRDAVVVTLEPVDGTPLTFVPGQYLTFRRDFDGVELRRSYSICAGRGEGRLQVGIKRVAGGAFSTWANTELVPGTVLEAMAPAGTFGAGIEPAQARSYLAFAGGSGITPILSILKTVLDEEPRSRFTLVYANRGIGSIMFREEIEALKNRHMGRLSVIHVLESDAQDIELFHGRLDAGKCAALFRHWVPVDRVDTAFICGPEPMMIAVRDSLQAHGMPADRVRIELFAGTQSGRLARPAGMTQAEAAARRITARITLDGVTRSVQMDGDTPILQAALDNALDAPFSCRAGVCSTCRCRITEGRVEMAANHALEDHEVAQGYVLSCQSYPVTETVAVDYDG